MKLKKLFLFFIIIVCGFLIVGCGGSTEHDDSDYSDKMRTPNTNEFYDLSRIIDRRISEETGDITTIKAYEKYTVREVLGLSLKDSSGIRPVYAVVDYEYRIEEQSGSKNSETEGYTYYVIFEDGVISKVVVDKELIDLDPEPANILNEFIMCTHELKQGYSWDSPNGFYSVVERYEYVALQSFKKTAPSFKIATYENKTDEYPIYIHWWCPELGWFVQYQDYDDLNYYILETISFEWDDED